MGMTATLDRMVHTRATHHGLGIDIGLGDCSAPGGSGGDLNPIDALAMSVASCLMLVMGKGARTKGIDLTGTWADIAYDLDDRVQVPGTRYLWGRWSYDHDSATPKWRAIRDEKGRILVAICHNSDVGDAWEWADSPRYPEHPASVAYRIGVNYILYGMTH